MLAMTGVITSSTKSHSLITLLQDIEYIHGQFFERTVESACGSVTCLPGALTMLRFSAFRRMAKYYFADRAEQCQDLFDYGKCHLGEDRWLTHLFMIGAKRRFQIQMCTSAFCKTEAVQTFRSLVKQRRRWFLGFITNEACMLTDMRIWRQYPVLCLVRFMQNTIRTTALLFFIVLVSIMMTSTTVKDLPVGFIAISLGLNWIVMIYLGIKLKRLKTWLYPLMFVLNPFFNWYYMVYGIFTAGQRTWGGPRADVASVDPSKTSEQVVEEALASGDGLNIVLETCKDSMGIEKEGVAVSRTPIPLQPPEEVEGHFSIPERGAEGSYRYWNKSSMTYENGARTSESLEVLNGSTIYALNGLEAQRRTETMKEEDRLSHDITEINLSPADSAEALEMTNIDLSNDCCQQPIDFTTSSGNNEPRLFGSHTNMSNAGTHHHIPEETIAHQIFDTAALLEKPSSPRVMGRENENDQSSKYNPSTVLEAGKDTVIDFESDGNNLRVREDDLLMERRARPPRRQYRRYRQKYHYGV